MEEVEELGEVLDDSLSQDDSFEEPAELQYYTTSMSGWSTNYTLTGDMAEDICRVAYAQLGKNGSTLAYTYHWCAWFVSDCARLAGIPTSILANTGYAYASNFGLSSSQEVSASNAQNGDIVVMCPGGGHVGIYYNGKIINGNNGSDSWSTNAVAYSTTAPSGWDGSVKYYRPNYTNSGVSTTYSTITPGNYYLVNNNSYLTVNGDNNTSVCKVSSFTGGKAQQFAVSANSKFTNGYILKTLNYSSGRVLNVYTDYTSTM